MRKIALILGMIMLSFGCSANQADFRLFHYNIKELDSTKIQNEIDQIKEISTILSKYQFDILSLNEIQYDLPGVPSTSYIFRGKNLVNLRQQFGLKHLKNFSFHPANTGMRAKPGPSGEYFTNPNDPLARTYADQVNFGTFPAQYSTGALYRYEKIEEKVYNNIAWKSVNSSLDLSAYRDNAGEELPKDVSLFDKNLVDVTLKIKDKVVHLILFHTVPAFHFGNGQTPNYQRNFDQLRFLEWYLTGETDIEINLPDVAPLPKGSYFIAVGDFNVAPDNRDARGSEVIMRLYQKLNAWLPQDKLSFTNESSNLAPNPFRLMLDYIFTSKNIETVHGEIIHPDFTRIEAGCGPRPADQKDYVLIEFNDPAGISCYSYVKEDYIRFKTASDHYPIYGEFRFR